MEEIIVLVDYKSAFSSKFNAKPPYSGLDKNAFSCEMEKFGYKLSYRHFFEIEFEKPFKYRDLKILYQSSEANDGYGEYKSFIDDVLYFLKIAGAELIPDYKYFKSHSNKVFMEMLRGFMNDENKPKTHYYGSFEDFENDSIKTGFPLVIKKSHGAQSLGVSKADSLTELRKTVQKVSKSTFTAKELIKEKIREKKYSSYKPFSIHRNKFVIQSFTPGLTGDYKILIFHDIFYLIKRDNRPNDFRASGGGFNSFLGNFEIPQGLLEYAFKIFVDFNCPYISLDIGVNENGFNLIEFQFINFGTSGQYISKFYLKKIGDTFEKMDNNLSLEYLYSYSLNAFFER